jgi:non-ribosomal peptide synthase protein (TIGR01720 family)
LAQGGAFESELPFWSRQLSGEASAELPPSEGRPRRAGFSVRLSTPKTAALFDAALGAYRVRPLDLLLTALARALCDLEGSSSARILVSCEARRLPTDAQDPQRTVGRFASSYPLRLSIEPGRAKAALAGSIEAVKEQLRAVPHGGLAYAALEQLASAEPRAALRALPQPSVSFSFDSNPIDLCAASPRLSLLAGALGPRPPLPLHPGSGLAFGAWLDRGRLVLRCRYRADRLPRDRAQRLLRSFRLELESLIDHCLTDAVSSMTPSDVVGATLSRDDLDAVLNALTEN